MLFASAINVLADGSQNLYPNGAAGARANTEWRTGSYGAGAITRRTLLHAYATIGEFLLVGSTAIGDGAADILIWNPGLVTGIPGNETIPATPSFSCAAQRASSLIAAQGKITSRAEELAGPDTIPAGGVANGYTPCYYAAPSTGIYSIAMVGPSGLLSNTDGGVSADVALAAAGDFSAAQGTSIAAWDVTVRDDLTDPSSTQRGRVFSYVLSLFTGNNGLPVNATTYAVTTDGFRYRIDQRGMDPDGWIEYGSQLGFIDPDGTTPLYHDALANNTGSPGQLTSVRGGVIFAPPTFPIFFTPPSNAALTALGIPLMPIASVVSHVGFSGTVIGSTSFFQSGGTFSYTSNVAGVFQIVISRDGVNFDPTNPQNRVLSGLKGAGAQTVSWDGKDNSSAFFPANPPGGSYLFKVDVHAGEYHFPFVDVENNTQGGPTVTMLNPPGGVCPPFTGGCNGGFYDDRGYTTTTGVTVGTPGSVLCGGAPPAVSFSNPITGYDTSGTQRAFGTASGGNTNVPCTGNFGDAKGLDLWTYYPSQEQSSALTIVAPGTYADIAVTKSVSNAAPVIGDDDVYTITAHDNGPMGATGVTVADVLPNGLVYVSSAASQGSYTAATGLWTIGALSAGASATLHITVRLVAIGAITNTASKSGETEIDPVPTNNVASVRIDVASAPTPPVPATGVPTAVVSIGLGLGLALFGVLLCAAALVTRRRTLVPTATRRSAAPVQEGARCDARSALGRNVKSRTSGSNGRGGEVSRLAPTPTVVPAMATKSSSEKPASMNQTRTVGVKSGEKVPRVQITVAFGALRHGSRSMVRWMSSSVMLPKMPQASTMSAGTAPT